MRDHRIAYARLPGAALPLTLLVLFLRAATAGSPPPALEFDFDDCVGLAIEQSPLLTRTSAEVSIRRIDEADARSRHMPGINMHTRYLITKPEGSDRRLTLHFTTDSYNPIEAVFGVRVSRMVTQIAALAHEKAIGEGLHQLGQAFLEMEALDQTILLRREAEELLGQAESYVTNRAAAGAATAIETRKAEQERRIARLEETRLLASLQGARENLALLLGLTNGAAVTFATGGAAAQVLGTFDEARADFPSSWTNSPEYRIACLGLQLQQLRIYLSYARYLPALTFGLQSTDPLYDSANDGLGLYFTAGLDFQLWDGLRRQRDVKRQRFVLSQYEADAFLEEANQRRKWLAAIDAVRAAAIDLDLATARAELAEINVEQAAFKSDLGRGGFPDLVDARRGRIEARRNLIETRLAHNKARLALRLLSGDLARSYIRVAEEDSPHGP